MKILVTGSAGHLGEALMRTLRARSDVEAIGLDVLPSPWTDVVGSIVDRDTVARCMRGVDAVLHAATLHKPHVVTHPRRAFVDVNVTGTLNLLEEAVAANVRAFVFTSTTSAFGDALVPAPGEPATWITEDVVPIPKNVYGITKLAAEDLCALMQRLHGLPCVVLRTSRFFPEEDDVPARRDAHDPDNLKVVELLHRRADIADIVDAHLKALDRAPAIGFGRYIVSATTPFTREDLADLPTRAGDALARHVPRWATVFASRGWAMPGIDRVYVNDRARAALDWTPRFDFAAALEQVAIGGDWRSELARTIGEKGYHRSPDT